MRTLDEQTGVVEFLGAYTTSMDKVLRDLALGGWGKAPKILTNKSEVMRRIHRCTITRKEGMQFLFWHKFSDAKMGLGA